MDSKQQSEYYLELFDLAPISSFILDKKGFILQANQAGSKILGKNCVKKQFEHFLCADNLLIFRLLLANIFAHHNEESGSFKLQVSEAHLFNVHLVVNFLQKSQTCFLQLIDISEFKKPSISSSTQLLLESFASAVFLTSIDGRIYFVNNSAVQMFGYSKKEFLKLHVDQLVPANIRHKHATLRENYAKKPFSRQMGELREVFAINKDGSSFPVEISLNPMVMTSGDLTIIAIVKDITERKQAEKNLHLTQFSIDNSADGVFWANSEGKILYANQSVADLLGYSKNELILTAIPEISSFCNEKNWKRHWLELKEKQVLRFEISTHKKNGELALFEITANYIQYQGNEYKCAFVRDISLRKQAENELRESEKRFRALFEHSGLSVAVYTTLTNIIVQVNQKYCNMLGYTEDELIGTNFMSFTHPDDKMLQSQKSDRLINGDINEYVIEKRCVCKNKEIIWVRITVSRMWKLGKIPYLNMAVMQNITEQKLAEIALQKSETRWFSTLEKAGFGLWNLDFKTKTVIYSKACKTMLGYGENEISNNNEDWEALVHPKDLAVVAKKFQDFTDGIELDYNQEFRILCKDGSWKWILSKSLRVFYNGNNKPSRIFGTHQDIDEKKQTEQKLKQLALVVEKTTVAVVITDADKKIEWVNLAFSKITGYEVNEVIGKTAGIFLQGEMTNKTTLAYMHDCLQKQQGFEVEILNYHKSGQAFWVHLKVDPIFNEQGELQNFVSIQNDITEKREKQQKLERSESLLRMSQKIAGIGYYVKELKSAITVSSHKLDCILGINADFKKTVQDLCGLVYHKDQKKVENRINYAIKNAQKLRLEHRIIRANDGKIRWIERHIDFERDSNNVPFVLLGTVQDITKKKKNEKKLLELNKNLEQKVVKRTQALAKAKELAEQASLAKSEFLSNMSHEIRTPINSINGMTYLALKTNPTAKQREYLNKINASGQHLLGIINDILDISKIEAGMLLIDSLPFNFKLIEDNLLSFFFEKTFNNKHYLTTEFDPNIPIALIGDSLRLNQILINFITNAIKFTPEGEIILRAKLISLSKINCTLRFEVEDKGIGLSAKQKKLLFQSFQQADSSISRKYGGSGLGLSICKQLAKLMQGKIGVESQLGLGSNFWVELPFLIGDINKVRHAKKQYHAISLLKNLKGKKILLVEDHPFNQQVAQEILEQAEMSVVVANNGLEAIDLLHKTIFDCVLMDMQMPEMDGVTATQKIRATPAIANNLIIAMTANAARIDQIKCLDAGMDDFISKPVDPEELYAVLEEKLKDLHLIANNNNSNNLSKSSHNVQKNFTDESKLIDLKKLMEIVGSKPETVKKFAFKFIETTEKSFQDFNQALNNKDISQIKLLAHRQKSSAKTLGATKLANLYESLESPTNNLEQTQTIIHNIDCLFKKIKFEINSSFSVSKETGFRMLTLADKSELLFVILDDDEMQIKLIKNMLNSFNILHLFTAKDGIQGLQILSELSKEPDIFIVDLNMPNMDGIEFLRHLAKKNYSSHIILLSGEGEEVLKSAKYFSKNTSLNIMGSLKKPIIKKELERFIRQIKSIKNNKSKFIHLKKITHEELENGIQQNELKIYVQPKVLIKNKHIAGVECLVRWQHPKRGLLMPDTFIAIAEQSNLINKLTLQVFSKAVNLQKKWQQQGYDIKVSFNISMYDLKDLNFPDILVELVQKAEMSVENIILELTETQLVEDNSIGFDILTRLRLKGFKLSMDDFGTGCATLERLNTLPVSELKIDRIFVNEALKDTKVLEILKSSINLGQNFNLNIVAEGVETQEDWDLVESLGCDEIQGYFIAKPMPAKQFIQWKQQWDAMSES